MKTLFVLFCLIIASPAMALDVDAPRSDVGPKCKCESVQNPQEMSSTRMVSTLGVLLLVGGFFVGASSLI